MGCVNPDGSLTSSARRLLRALEQEHTAEEVGELAGQPLFKVRSSLREMVETGLVEESDGQYKTTDLGRSQAAKGEQ